MWETELNWLNDWPLQALSFARLVSHEQLALSSKPSRNLLCTTILDIILTNCALTLARAFAAATCWARQRQRHCRSLNILTAREPMGLSSRRRLLLLASNFMALTRERKKPSQIAREIEIFSIFAWLVPTLVPKHTSRFRIFSSTICWSLWSINIYETLGGMKFAVSLCNVVSAPCSETGLNLMTLLFVGSWLSITKLLHRGFSILIHNKSTL